jgi:hypothetical protein
VSAPATDPAERLERARAALRQATSNLGDHAQARRRSTSVPGAGVVPVSPALAGLFPDGGLRRGSTVRVRSSTSLLFALLAEASTRGTWCAIVGMPSLGVVAAHEAGIDLSRLALIPNPGADLIAVTSALLDGIDLIALAGTGQLRPTDRQRLAAKTRQRGAVLLPTGPWPGADLEVGLTDSAWRGLGGDGHGRLQSRRTQVRLTGRTGPAHRGRKTTVLLPGPAGAATGLDWADTRPGGGTPAMPVTRDRQAG